MSPPLASLAPRVRGRADGALAAKRDRTRLAGDDRPPPVPGPARFVAGRRRRGGTGGAVADGRLVKLEATGTGKPRSRSALVTRVVRDRDGVRDPARRDKKRDKNLRRSGSSRSSRLIICSQRSRWKA